MLPENVFDELLSTFSLKKPSAETEVESFEAIPHSMATDGTGAFAEPSVSVWYRNGGRISFDQFHIRLKEELRNLGHKSSDGIVGAIVALYTANPNRRDGPTSVLNATLARVVDGDLSQFFIFQFPPFPGFQSFKIGRFSIGELEVQKLAYRSKRAGSDYFQRYEQSLLGRFAIERDVIQARVINLEDLMKEYGVGEIGRTAPGLWNRCTEAYFQALAAAYFDDFWAALMEDQHLVIACGTPYFDDRHLRTAPYADAVSVFLNINHAWGHVAPGSLRGLKVDFMSLDRQIPKAMARLHKEFELAQDTNIPPPLKNYVFFVAKGKRYLDDALPDEAFVHYVISLELLFGERARTNESVSKRAATLVFRPFAQSLLEAEKQLGRLYDLRSRYVHSGQKIDTAQLGEVKDICEQVLCSFLRRLQHRQTEGDLIGKWTKDLDYLYSALIAGKIVAEEDFASCGILPAPVTNAE